LFPKNKENNKQASFFLQQKPKFSHLLYIVLWRSLLTFLLTVLAEWLTRQDRNQVWVEKYILGAQNFCFSCTAIKIFWAQKLGRQKI